MRFELPASGQQTIVDTSELQLPPENQRKNFTVEKKNYVFDKTKKGDKKEWHVRIFHFKNNRLKIGLLDFYLKKRLLYSFFLIDYRTFSWRRNVVSSERRRRS